MPSAAPQRRAHPIKKSSLFLTRRDEYQPIPRITVKYAPELTSSGDRRSMWSPQRPLSRLAFKLAQGWRECWELFYMVEFSKILPVHSTGNLIRLHFTLTHNDSFVGDLSVPGP